MLGSLDPVIIIQLFKKVKTKAAAGKERIPLVSDILDSVKATYAVIPIYLSETVTGVYIDTESKSINIDTDTQSLSSGEGAIVNQKTLGSITSISLLGKQGSIGLTILLALAEQIVDKVTSQEYEITYMHGGVTVFAGLLHDLSFEQGTNDDLYRIKIELARGRPRPKSVVVSEDPSATRLASTGSVPPPDAPTAAAAGAKPTQIAPAGIGRMP